MRILELFSGVGGWRYAMEGLGEVVAAYDISPAACATYALNHGEAPIPRELATLPLPSLIAHRADTWVMSPPCQPFCRMGNHHGLEDKRSRAFLRLMELFDEAPPQHLVLENVLGFQGSDAHDLLLSHLARHGLHYREYQLCPTAFGIPNRRERFYLVASHRPLPALDPPSVAPGTLEVFLDEAPDPRLYLDAETLSRHASGLDFVIAPDRNSTCFIGGYGQRYVGSGSFIATPQGVRRFSPPEIARIMGLPATFRFPEEVSLEQRYKLLGNGLSIPVARWVASQVGNLARA